MELPSQVRHPRVEPRAGAALLARGRPATYGAAHLPALQTIWLAAQQPCGKRLAAALRLWLPYYEATHRERLVPGRMEPVAQLFLPGDEAGGENQGRQSLSQTL